jgi:hypothetical protein
MKSKDKIRTLNIVYIHWTKQSLNIKLNALKKIQRFCRRGSGNHAHPSMIRQQVKFGYSCNSPPVLYRQVQTCTAHHCTTIPIRVYNKHQRIEYALDKFTQGDSQDILFNQKRRIVCHYCFCNNKPFHCYKSMFENPRYNFTSKDGIKYIMCELSGDQLTYYTRFKLSQYLTNRLR